MQARQEAAKKAEEAAQEAERLAKEAADKLVKEKSGKDAIHAKTGPVSALPNAPSTSSTPNDSKTVKSAGIQTFSMINISLLVGLINILSCYWML